jgi:hypothetical protein
MAIVLTFTGQVLLASSSDLSAPLFPYGIWVILTLALSLIPVAVFKGQYLRLEVDTPLLVDNKNVA